MSLNYVASNISPDPIPMPPQDEQEQEGVKVRSQ